MINEKNTSNPWHALTTNHAGKDIDHNFVQSLEALVFFNEDHMESINADDCMGLFLLRKLSENLRRLYSAHGRDGQAILSVKTPTKIQPGKISVDCRKPQAHSSVKELQEQQDLIYAALQLVAPHIRFSEQAHLFTRFQMGRDVHCAASTAFFTMGLHEWLYSENEQRHVDIFKQCFNLQQISQEIFLLNKSLTYKPGKSSLVQQMLEPLPQEFFVQACMHKEAARGSLVVDLMLHCAANKVALSAEQKSSLLAMALHAGNILHKRPHEYGVKLAKSMATYFEDHRAVQQVERIIMPERIGKDALHALMLHLTSRFRSPIAFIRATSTFNVSEEQKHAIFSRYDFASQETILAIAQAIHKTFDTAVAKEKLFVLCQLCSEQIDNKTIVGILTLNTSYMEVIKPIYERRKLDKLLPIQSKTSSKMKL